MSDVTRILAKIDAGDPAAAEQLLPLVYDELRKLATAKLAQERPGQTLQATALVHEAYLRLLGSTNPAEPDSAIDGSVKTRPVGETYNSRGHFFAAAAEAMRRILVEQARRKASLKRGGQWQRQPLGEIALKPSSDADELLSLDDALTRLAAADHQAAQVVQLRYFAGLTIDQTAEALGISPRTACYAWDYARSWLRQELRGPEAAR